MEKDGGDGDEAPDDFLDPEDPTLGGEEQDAFAAASFGDSGMARALENQKDEEAEMMASLQVMSLKTNWSINIL
jgi:hypothetical protein